MHNNNKSKVQLPSSLLDICQNLTNFSGNIFDVIFAMSKWVIGKWWKVGLAREQERGGSKFAPDKDCNVWRNVWVGSPWSHFQPEPNLVTVLICSLQWWTDIRTDTFVLSPT